MPTIYKPKRRDQTSQRRKERMAIYNTARWRKMREAKLLDNPLCEICERNGITRMADDVHHIQSFMSTDNPESRKVLAFDYDNLMSVCDECHSAIHNKNKMI